MPTRRAAPRRPREPDPDPDVLARLGHELRTPLTAILGFSELMLRQTFGVIGNPRYVDYARFIHEGAGRMLATIDALHRLAHLDQGRIVPARSPQRLAEIARAALDAAQPRASERGVALVAGALDPSSVVTGDRSMLAALAGELIANAIAFTPEGGRVEVSVARAGGSCRLVVSDSGVGVPPERRRAVLEPFVQLKPTGVPGSDGPGLGLAMALRIARLHGGRLALAAARGGGTTAILSLPAAPARAKKR